MNMLETIVRSNKTALFFAIGVAVIPLINQDAYKYFIYAFALFLVIYLIFFIKDLFLIKILQIYNRFPAVYISVEHDWHLSEQGDFYAQSVYTIKNIGDGPISILPLDNLAWSDQLGQVEFKLRVHDDSKNTHRIVEYGYNIYFSFLFLLAGTKKEKTKFISWSNVIDPPLSKGKSFKYVLEINTPKTEKEAFTDEGTYAGIPANLPTRSAKLNYVAPKGYFFELIETLRVVDAQGTVYPDDAKGVNPPHLTPARSILQWELKNLKTGRRYWFKYRLVKNDQGK